VRSTPPDVLSRHSRLKSSHNASHEESRFHAGTCGELSDACLRRYWGVTQHFGSDEPDLY